MTSGSIIHMDLHEPNSKLVRTFLVHERARGTHIFTRCTFPFIVLFVIGHGGCIQMSFSQDSKLGVLKFSKLGLSPL